MYVLFVRMHASITDTIHMLLGMVTLQGLDSRIFVLAMYSYYARALICEVGYCHNIIWCSKAVWHLCYLCNRHTNEA